MGHNQNSEKYKTDMCFQYTEWLYKLILYLSLTLSFFEMMDLHKHALHFHKQHDSFNVTAIRWISPTLLPTSQVI